MKKKLLLFMAMVLACGAMMVPKAAMADVTGSDSFTVTIPEAAGVTFVSANAGAFDSIVSSDFDAASNIQANNALLVGNGITASSTSFVISNIPATTGDKQFTITPTGTSGDTATITNNVLTVTDSVAGASVDIIMRPSGGLDTAYPTLGDPAGTIVSFAYLAGGNGSLNIPISQSVPFDATTNKAPLDMTLDINEGSLSYTADPPGTITFDLTLTVVGVN